MRAALLYGPDDLRIEDIEIPEPAKGEVVLTVTRALACGTDLKMFRRGHPALRGYPSRFGHEFAGVIAAVGDHVDRFDAGDDVFCANSAPCRTCFQCRRGRLSLCEDLLYLFGGFAEQITVPERIVQQNMHRLPAGLTLELAPLAEPLACSLHGIERSGIRNGDTVVIIGAGSIGIMLAALAARAGGHPIVIDPHEERRELARAFGATETVNAQRSPADAATVRSITDGRGADHVFEAVGRPEAWELAVAMACAGGTVNFFGGCQRGTEVRVPTERVHYEEITLQGTYHHTPDYVARALEVLAERSFPWDELLGRQVGLGELEGALCVTNGSPRKLVVDPWKAG